ncbi:MAG TPA: glycosyltransferase family 39 protein [Pirellulales bacterium]|nr:glycosyltransferase family 39 protein [Pirellulales bacterium]
MSTYQQAATIHRAKRAQTQLGGLIVPVLLTAYWLLALGSSANKSNTFDEIAHITAGYSYWSQNDYRLQPENGNWPQRWMAIPLVVLGYQYPDLTNDQAWQVSSVWEVGKSFFFKMIDTGTPVNDVKHLLLWSRGMMGLVAVALGALTYSIAKRLFDVRVARAALVLFAFCPSMLCNGVLATSDIAATFFFLASVWCAWQLLHALSIKNLLLSCLATGGLFLSKFSSPLVIPMIGVLAVLRLARGGPLPVIVGRRMVQLRGRVQQAAAMAVMVAAHMLVAWVMVWVSYGLRFDAMARWQPGRDHLQFSWDYLLGGGGAIASSIGIVKDAHLLPESFLFGFAFVHKNAQARSAFLNGEYSVNGWPQFFPYCLLVKTPLTLFVLIGLAFAAVATSWRLQNQPPEKRDSWAWRAAAGLYHAAPLWTLFIVYWAAAVSSHLNIGHRHILPTYPPMFILAGAAAMWLRRSAVSHEARRAAATVPAPIQPAVEHTTTEEPSTSPTKRRRRRERVEDASEPKNTSMEHWLKGRRHPILASTVLVMIALFVTESVLRAPNYLAYFNQLIGAPSNAYEHLVDSSLDWGQELPSLKAWLVREGLDAKTAPPTDDAKPPKKVFFSYFGTASPTYYGIEAQMLPCFFEITPPHLPQPLDEGVYCISATMLQTIYTAFPGPWNRNYESIYQQLVNNLKVFDGTAGNPTARQELITKTGEPFWFQTFQQYEHARLARLCSYLRKRNPDHEINYAILIYRLTRSDLSRALEGPPVELEEVPEPPKK